MFTRKYLINLWCDGNIIGIIFQFSPGLRFKHTFPADKLDLHRLSSNQTFQSTDQNLSRPRRLTLCSNRSPALRRRPTARYCAIQYTSCIFIFHQANPVMSVPYFLIPIQPSTPRISGAAEPGHQIVASMTLNFILIMAPWPNQLLPDDCYTTNYIYLCFHWRLAWEGCETLMWSF